MPLGICSLSLCFLSILYDVLLTVVHAIVTFRSEVFALFYFRPVVARKYLINPLNPELNPICFLLALLAYHFLHVSRIMVKSLTLRLLMTYIYGAHILDVSRSHTKTHRCR